jgi:hypothetical protein
MAELSRISAYTMEAKRHRDRDLDRANPAAPAAPARLLGPNHFADNFDPWNPGQAHRPVATRAP